MVNRAEVRFSKPYIWSSHARRVVRSVRERAQILKARRLLLRHGPVVANAAGVGLSQQLAALLSIGIRYGVSPEDFYRYRLYEMPKGGASNFLKLRAHIHRREWIFNRLAIPRISLTDKRSFYKRCGEVGLPVPETIAELDNGTVRWWSDGELPACDLFSKEGASLCGAGASLWRYNGAGRWRDEAGGRLVDKQNLISILCRQSVSTVFVLQRRIMNLPAMAALGPVGLCTARIVTTREPDDPTPRVLLGVFRMPTGGDVADNFARGGLACPIDLATGTLGLATYKKLSYAHLDVTTHPDSGARIVGKQLPHWNEAIALALRAHHYFAEFPSVGWDIAFSPEGLMLVEGNYNWDVVLAQQAGLRPLGATWFAEHERAWYLRAKVGLLEHTK